MSLIIQCGERVPDIDAQAFVASNATVIGSVRMGEGSSVWFQAVIRGDNDLIDIGPNTNIQDGAVVHTDEGIPMKIGSGVTVGHKAVLHGCSIGANSLIGINATVLNHADIGEECLVGANALVTEGKKIPPRSLVLGSPAKVVRSLTDEEVAEIRASARHYREKIKLYQRQAYLLP